MRHLSNGNARFTDNTGKVLETAELDQVRNVYRLGARWMPTENTEIRAGYQLDDPPTRCTAWA